jgi:thiamine biosynthesis lipoprotein
MELDFGGIGKEYAADQAAEVCSALGIRHGLIELGGDIAVIGRHPNLNP